MGTLNKVILKILNRTAAGGPDQNKGDSEITACNCKLYWAGNLLSSRQRRQSPIVTGNLWTN